MNEITPTKDWTLGASQANELALGRLPELWAEARGLRPKLDLSDNLPVLIGSALEPLHVMWFQRRTQLMVHDEQMRLSRPDLGLHATLDGWVHVPQFGLCAWEAKTTGASTKLETMKARVHAQLAIQCALLDKAPEVVLSILWRTPAWNAVLVTPCPDLTAELIERAAILRYHVMAGTMPPDLPPCRVTMPPHRPLPFTA